MRKVINSTYITLDGVIVNPQDWPSSGISDDTGGIIQTELLQACDAVLMGKYTYEAFAAVWQSRSGDPYTDRINHISKYVVSSTLKNPTWNNTTVISGDPVEHIARLKQEPGLDIVQYGFGPLSHAMMERGLIDELRLWVYPVILGKSAPEGLLYRNTSTRQLNLVNTKPLKTGVVILTYQVGGD